MANDETPKTQEEFRHDIWRSTTDIGKVMNRRADDGWTFVAAGFENTPIASCWHIIWKRIKETKEVIELPTDEPKELVEEKEKE